MSFLFSVTSPLHALQTQPPKGKKTAGQHSTKSSTSSKSAVSPLKPNPTTVAEGATSAGARALDGKAAPVWPVKTVAPLPGSILPTNRIVAFYGNPLSKKMGVLGEYPKDEMFRRLDHEVAAWTRADPSTPVKPALHLIAVVAQGDSGKDGMFRMRHSHALIEKTYAWAKEKNALLFLDVQVGLSTIRDETPKLDEFLLRPDVHLGMDPEFSMKDRTKPGKKIGTYDAADVNWVIDHLANIVTQNHLPPKILVVHRFTQRMLTNADKIKLDPRVQVVIDMDGWGPQSLKRDSYAAYVYAEPVQFAGFKLFYKNDLRKGGPLMTPAQILGFRPRPLYIQYQ
ncbi:MAG: hypothetical protein M3Y64_08040 [Gemmatimonadota bacterium]|nr:hypothetical protein [Gemmatimonadota bacterium]